MNNETRIEDVVGSAIIVSTDMADGEYAERKGGKVWIDLVETAENNSTSWCGNLEQVRAMIEALQKVEKEELDKLAQK